MESLWNAIEGGFAKLGLVTPASRFGAVFLVTAGGEYIVKPPYAYSKEGEIRPIYFMDPQFGTMMPAFVIPAILGFVCATVF